MKTKNYYRVGGHTFSISFEDKLIENITLASYKPFKIDPEEKGIVFDVDIVEKLDVEIIEPIIVDAPLSSSGMPNVDIYKVNNGYLYNITSPYSDQVNASLVIDNTQRTATISLMGSEAGQRLAISNALILSYMSFTMELSTLLLHASTVIYEGKAYLFLGKSGTGKSTHSKMWLSAHYSSELLNDDHPIIRTFEDGSITVYGSPWSGKTPCYRNLSAPLGAVVRIKRSEENWLEELRPLKAFASITTSCSGVQWSKRLMNGKIKTIEDIVKRSKGYAMHCLPNEEAAQVCYKGIMESR